MSLSSCRSLISIFALSALSLGGCNSSPDKTTEQTATNATSKTNSASQKVTTVKGMDISLFEKSAFTQEPIIVDCETAEGKATSCYKFITNGAPAGRHQVLSVREQPATEQMLVAHGLAKRVLAIWSILQVNSF